MLDIAPSYDYEAFYHGNMVQRWWKRKIAETVWEWIPDGEFLNIIDLACGTSPIIAHYERPVAMDIDAAKIEWASEKWPHVQYLAGDCTDTKFLDGTFNAVLAIEVIEHLPRSVDLLKEIARICDDSAKVIIATPDYNSPVWWAVEGAYKLLKPNQYCHDHVSKFDFPSLVTLAGLAGLRYVRHRRIAGADMIVMFEKL